VKFYRQQKNIKGKVDIYLIRLFLQAGFSLLVCSTCIFKIVTTEPDSKYEAVYWSTITGVLGSWLPSPARDRDNSEDK
jgi:hypothetical protein